MEAVAGPGGLAVDGDGLEGGEVGGREVLVEHGMPVQAGIFMHSGKVTFPAQSAKSDVTLVFRNPKAGQKDLFIYINSELGN